MPFTLAEHTADVGIEAAGATREEALEAAADGLVAILTGRTHHHELRPDAELVFSVEAPDLPALVVAFLSELLWHFESRDLLWTGGGVAFAPETRDGILRLDVRGNAAVHDPTRHGRGVEVKAVTYHELAFGRTGQGWHLRVILDI